MRVDRNPAPGGRLVGPVLLEVWIRHRNPANLVFHAGSGLVGWLGLVAGLAAVPTPFSLPVVGGSVGIWLALASPLAWRGLDAMVALVIGILSVCVARVAGPIWPVGLALFVVSAIAQRQAHVLWHEHASFLVGQSPWRRAAVAGLSTLFAPFLFVPFWLLDRGWRPALRRALVAAERETLLRRRGGPWQNWAGTVTAAPATVSVPQTLGDLVEVVREARQAGRAVRVVGSGFSWSSVVPTSDLLVFIERLDRVEIDRSDADHPAVWAEAGVTNRILDRALAEVGLAMPWNVVLENVRIAGIVSAGTHGSGLETATMGDLLLAVEVVDSAGEVRLLSEDTIGVEGMRAVRCGLGLFGVILRVRLRVVPDWRVRQVDRVDRVETVLRELPALVRRHDSLELYWFAFNRDVWVRSFDRTDAPSPGGLGIAFSALNLVQNTFLRLTAPAFQGVARRWFPAFQRFAFRRLTFRTRILPIADALHYRKWIEMMPCGCVEVGFPMDAGGERARAAFAAAITLVERYGARGLYPMNLTLNVRFIGESDALLSPAFEARAGACYIEALCLGRPEGWAEFSAELVAEWMKIPGALPHWAKEFEHVPGIETVTRAHLGERLDRFRAALDAADPGAEAAFSNPLLRRVLLSEAREPMLRSANGA